jgi:hypothetical protein
LVLAIGCPSACAIVVFTNFDIKFMSFHKTVL